MMEWSTKEDAKKIALKVKERLGKHSVCALVRAIGYDIERKPNGNLIISKRELFAVKVVDYRCKTSSNLIGTTTHSELLYFLVINGHDFSEFLKESDPDYKKFFEEIKVHNRSVIEEYSVPNNRK